MTSRSICGRLDRLEQQLAPLSEEPLVEALKYVSTDGEVGRLAALRCLRCHGTAGSVMINKSLTRRLERLEEEINPGEPEIIILHIHGVDREGKVMSTQQITVATPPRPIKKRPR